MKEDMKKSRETTKLIFHYLFYLIFIKIILILNNRLKVFNLFDKDKRNHILNAIVEFYSNIIIKFIIFTS